MTEHCPPTHTGNLCWVWLWDGPFSGTRTRRKGIDRWTWSILGGCKHQKLSALRSQLSILQRSKLALRGKQEALLKGCSGGTFREVACQMKVFSSCMRTIVWAVSPGSLWRIDSYPLLYPNLINLTKPIHWYSVNIPISSLVRILLSLFPLISAAHSILTTSDPFFSLFC